MKNLYTEIHDSVYLDSLGRCDYLGKVSDEVHWKITDVQTLNNKFMFETLEPYIREKVA